MNIQSHSDQKTGILRIVDGIKSDQKARSLRSGLGDLPGVHRVEIIGSAVRVHFNPQIVTEQKFYQGDQDRRLSIDWISNGGIASYCDDWPVFESWKMLGR